MEEKRSTIRFNKVFPVTISSREAGEMGAIARNISRGGMLIETYSPLPLGSEICVHFRTSTGHGEIAVRAEVKNHYSFNYTDQGEPRSARGMGVRFVEFVEEADEPARSRVEIPQGQTLH